MDYLCYHHNDMDGKAAGNEVYLYLKSRGINCLPSMFIMRGYDEPFSEDDYSNKEVYIVDLSFTKESIKKLFAICEGAASVTWIDHHESSRLCIEDEDICKKLDSYENLKYFVNQDACGALLSHIWFNYDIMHTDECKSCLDFEFKTSNSPVVTVSSPDMDSLDINIVIPKFLNLIDLWDRWAYGDYEDPVLFNYGADVHSTALFVYKDKNDSNKFYNNNFWSSVRSEFFIDNLIRDGKIAKKYFDMQSDRAVNSNSYECDILGKKALVLNSSGNSQVFGDRIKDYDLVCLWDYNGKTNKYTYSLYSDDKVNCAEIATKLDPNGGGHPGAAGFSSDKLIFKPSK